MKITSLVENTSNVGLPTEHGLSLHITLNDGRRLLFDMGQRRLFADNAIRLDIDLSAVDIAILSHGHYDHGGGLHAFLQLNNKAKVYVNSHAFEPHYSLRNDGLRYIGLDERLKDNEQIAMCNGSTRIDEGLTTISDVESQRLIPVGNRLLFGPARTTNDDFRHEQSLVIEEENKIVLVAGCAHKGIVNIMHKAEQVVGQSITHVVSGMHLMKSCMNEADEGAYINKLTTELMTFDGCSYITMHCTGISQYAMLKKEMGDAITYLSCGETIEI